MRIQKGVFVLLLIFNFLSLRSYVYADIWDLKFPLLFPTSTPKPTSFFIKKIPPLFFLPTNTPTITPSPTDAPTSTPAPTETPFPTPSIELSPSTTPTAPPITPSPKSSTPSTKEIIMLIVIGILVFGIFFQLWPKIKTWIHEKTK
ncbi:hypothetical protein A2446_04015 [Candidatus Roizmanbacteria bacterium RIFOXYC2_FULL_38_9]|nr:MAG: hypothetical protein A2446_04015 [Candidatus Roizmanbacteria bacterium RIFOXYC2_FULL_38_9]